MASRRQAHILSSPRGAHHARPVPGDPPAGHRPRRRGHPHVSTLRQFLAKSATGKHRRRGSPLTSAQPPETVLPITASHQHIPIIRPYRVVFPHENGSYQPGTWPSPSQARKAAIAR